MRIRDSAVASPWKQRFRAPMVLWTQLAGAASKRGLAASSKPGAYQLHAWDVPTGRLRQLTDRPEGKLFGTLSPDGRYVYYMDDRQGNEIGHYVRKPFEGGEPQDITPDLLPYASSGFATSQAGNLFGFTLTNGKPIEIYWFEAGHLGRVAQVERSIQDQERMLRFACHILGR